MGWPAAADVPATPAPTESTMPLIAVAVGKRVAAGGAQGMAKARKGHGAAGGPSGQTEYFSVGRMNTSN